MNRKSAFAALLVSTAVAPVLFAQAALAQEAAQPQGEQNGLLGEVVVTATRQADTVNRVPLSVTAVTQKSLDQQGIKTVSDLGATVPALRVSGPAGNVQISIRGIASSQGTPTTGIYLDDTPLQKRYVNGTAGNSNNGSPVPPLFDVERVEVLRGPQGTLYGGSSQGGTVRFITPRVSLTRRSLYARTELSGTKGGDASYEGGISVGGPIVQDKLGFRGSIYARHIGGYMDYLDAFKNGAAIIENGNSGLQKAANLSIAWQVNDRGRVTLNWYSSHVRTEDQNAGSYTLPTTSGLVVQTSCFRVAPGQRIMSPAPVDCAGAGITYRRPGTTLGPYPYLGPTKTLQRAVEPSTTNTLLPSVVLEYEFPTMAVKSISSYIEDSTKGMTLQNQQWANVNMQANFNGINVPSGISLNWLDPEFAGRVRSKNERHGITQELRFASAGNAMPFNWVGGIFYSNIKGKSFYDGFEDPDRIAQEAYGISAVQRFGVGALPNGSTSRRLQYLNDTEIAAFGEGNYYVTDKLKVTAGIRMSRVSFDYYQELAGTINGALDPKLVVGGITQGSVTESPVTPKIGASYQITDNDMIYVSAAKGFRPGGVNTPLSEAICGQRVRDLGLTLAGIPTSYNSDQVWSYEGGAKVRVLNNRLQLNSSAFRIDWTNVQLPVTLGGNCGQTFTINAGAARSQGFDLEAQARPFKGLTTSLAVGYTNAKYTATATLGTGATAPVVAIGGQKFVLPPWSFTVSARYDFQIGKYNGYIRAEDRYASSYTRNFLGTTGYSPDTTKGVSTNIVTARMGVEVRGVDVNLFMNNVFNNQKGNQSGGRSGCTVASGAECSVFTTYNPFFTIAAPRPREFGIQASYRY